MFGKESSFKALEWLSQYKKLQAKKLVQPLSENDQRLLSELETKLSQAVDPQAPKEVLEKRRGLRVRTSIQVAFKNLKDLGRAYIKNISGGGIYIETQKFSEIGTILNLELSLPDSKEPMIIETTVAWLQTKATRDLAPGMGLKFQNLTAGQSKTIQELVERALEQELTKS